MARITWDNVVAPDFRGSMQGFKNASDMLSGAFDSARGGLKDFDTTRRNRVSRVVAERMAKITDDEEMQAALKTGELFQGVNPELLDAESYEAAMARPQALLQNENSRLRNESATESNRFTKWGNQVTQDERDQSIALAPHLAEYNTAKETGDPAKIAAAQTKLMETAAGLGMTTESVIGLANDADGLVATNQSHRGTDLNYEEQSYGFGRRVLTDKENTELDNRQQLIEESANTQEEAAQLIRGMSDLPPRMRGELARRFNIPGVVTPEEIAGIGGGGGTSDPVSAMSVVNYEARGRGFGSVPASVKSLGDLDAWGTTVLKGSDGSFSSASGPYQITRNTMRKAAPAALGKDWKSLPNTPENHDKVAKYLFDEAKRSNKALRNEWAMFDKMSDAQVAAVRNMPWEEARAVISNGEASVDINALLRDDADFASTQTARGRVDPINRAVDQTVDDYAETAGSKMRLETAASKLREDDRFKGMNQVDARKLLKWVKGRAEVVRQRVGGDSSRVINDEMALRLLMNDGVWGSDTIGNNAANIFGNGLPVRDSGSFWKADEAVNEELMDNEIAKILDGSFENNLNQRDSISSDINDIESLKSERSRLETIISRAQGRGNSAEREKARLAEINKEISAISKKQTRTGNTTKPAGRRTVPKKKESLFDFGSFFGSVRRE